MDCLNLSLTNFEVILCPLHYSYLHWQSLAISKRSTIFVHQEDIFFGLVPLSTLSIQICDVSFLLSCKNNK